MAERAIASTTPFLMKVTVFQATTGKVMARLEAEQANPQADVLISASWTGHHFAGGGLENGHLHPGLLFKTAGQAFRQRARAGGVCSPAPMR
jgi:ABC-type Fe3+ transport system substrate-binding protein